MAFPFAAVLGGASLIAGLVANEQQRKAARSAANSQRALVARQLALFDAMEKRVKDMEASGAFDPTKALENMEKQTAKYESRDMGNLAGALRVAGYRPGDSEIGARLDSVKTAYRDFLDTKRVEIPRMYNADKLAAYGSLNSGALNSGIEVFGRNRDLALAQIQNPAGFLAAWIPFLEKKRQQEPQVTTSGVLPYQPANPGGPYNNLYGPLYPNGGG